MRFLLAVLFCVLTLVTSASAAPFRGEIPAPTSFGATPLIWVVMDQAAPNGTMHWCNVYMYDDTGSYSSSSGQLQPVHDGYLFCVFDYNFLNHDHVAADADVWVSDTYLGDPLILANGSVAETEISYP